MKFNNIQQNQNNKNFSNNVALQLELNQQQGQKWIMSKRVTDSHRFNKEA